MDLICFTCDEVLTPNQVTKPIYGCENHDEFSLAPEDCSQCGQPYHITNRLYCLTCGQPVYIGGSIRTEPVGENGQAVRIQGYDEQGRPLPCAETALVGRRGSTGTATGLVIECMSELGYAVAIELPHPKA